MKWSSKQIGASLGITGVVLASSLVAFGASGSHTAEAANSSQAECISSYLSTGDFASLRACLTGSATILPNGNISANIGGGAGGGGNGGGSNGGSPNAGGSDPGPLFGGDNFSSFGLLDGLSLDDLLALLDTGQVLPLDPTQAANLQDLTAVLSGTGLGGLTPSASIPGINPNLDNATALVGGLGNTAGGLPVGVGSLGTLPVVSGIGSSGATPLNLPGVGGLSGNPLDLSGAALPGGLGGVGGIGSGLINGPAQGPLVDANVTGGGQSGNGSILTASAGGTGSANGGNGNGSLLDINGNVAGQTSGSTTGGSILDATVAGGNSNGGVSASVSGNGSTGGSSSGGGSTAGGGVGASVSGGGSSSGGGIGASVGGGGASVSVGGGSVSVGSPDSGTLGGVATLF